MHYRVFQSYFGQLDIMFHVASQGGPLVSHQICSPRPLKKNCRGHLATGNLPFMALLLAITVRLTKAEPNPTVLMTGLANSFKLLFPVVGGNISVLTVKDASAQTYVYLYLNDSKIPKLYQVPGQSFFNNLHFPMSSDYCLIWKNSRFRRGVFV